MSTSSEGGEESMISINKKNETLRNVQPWHNTRSNRIQTKQNRPKNRIHSALLCFATSRLELTSCSLKIEQPVSRLLPMNSHTCTLLLTPMVDSRIRRHFQTVCFINSL